MLPRAGRPALLIGEALADCRDRLLAGLGDVGAEDPFLWRDGADLVAADGGDLAVVDAGVLVGRDAGMAHVLELKLGATRHGLGGRVPDLPVSVVELALGVGPAWGTARRLWTRRRPICRRPYSTGVKSKALSAWK